ncbi:MAG: TetR/AcrR family transcriptional regulator [Pseudomonadota bacterium]
MTNNADAPRATTTQSTKGNYPVATVGTDDPKERAIISAARQIFLSNGFDGASMDAIAHTAGVSKRTVYNRFQSKEALFGAAIEETCKRILPVSLDGLETAAPIEQVIEDLARSILYGILEPEAIALRRIATFEAGRKPELGHSFLEHGLHYMINAGTAIFERLAAANDLDIDDPHTAICQLGALITEPLYSELLLGGPPDNLDAAIEKQLSDGLSAFWKLYGGKS